MQTVKSTIQRTMCYDMGNFRHVVTYSADDTDPKNVAIAEASDHVINLVAQGVASDPKGTLRYAEGQVMADNIVVCPCFDGIVADFKAIIEAIEKGNNVEERPFEEKKE